MGSYFRDNLLSIAFLEKLCLLIKYQSSFNIRTLIDFSHVEFLIFVQSLECKQNFGGKIRKVFAQPFITIVRKKVK